MVPTSAVQRGPAGTFSYVIGADNIATAKPVVVTQQNENDAVIASGLSTSDRVVTTGFANLSDGAKVLIGTDDRAPTADLAPRKRSRSPDAKGRMPRTSPRAVRARTASTAASASAARAIRRDKPDPAPAEPVGRRCEVAAMIRQRRTPEMTSQVSTQP